MTEIDSKSPTGKSNRRTFLARLAGAAALPLLLPRRSYADCGDYLGPNLFNAYLSDPTGQTRAQGVATFEVVTSDGCLSDAKIAYQLKLTHKAVAIQGFLVLEDGIVVLNLPDGTPASIPPNPETECTFIEMLRHASQGELSMKLNILVSGQVYTLAGKLTPAPNSNPISVSEDCTSW